jgi:predicted kinase/2'-5' RNA ligase
MHNTWLSFRLSDEARASMNEINDRLCGHVDPMVYSDIHMTAIFVGKLLSGKTVNTLSEVNAAIKSATKKYVGPRRFVFDQFSLCPRDNPPEKKKTVIAFYKENTHLREFVLGLRKELSVLGVCADQSPFTPHITVGRLKKIPPPDLDALGPYPDIEVCGLELSGDGNRHLDSVFPFPGFPPAAGKHAAEQHNYATQDPKNAAVARLRDKIKARQKIAHDDPDVVLLVGCGLYMGHLGRFMASKDPVHVIGALESFEQLHMDAYDLPSDHGGKVFANFLASQWNSQEMKQPPTTKRETLLMVRGGALVRHEMPRNFSWVVPGVIGGISAVRNGLDLEILGVLGVRRIYYFLPRPEFDHIGAPSGPEIRYVTCENGKTPSLGVMHQVVREADGSGFPVLFGCLGGFGRTGTALACYLAYRSHASGGHMSSEQTVTYLRSIRPKSIENAAQTQFVRDYTNYLHTMGTVIPSDARRSPSAATTRGKCPHKGLKLVILTGLPGAGKTTFSELLLSSGLDIQIISQDTMGRAQCVEEFGRSLKERDITLLDMTNVTKKHRKEWIQDSMLSPKQTVCVHLATPQESCIERSKTREHHPTSKGVGSRIIKDMARKFESPAKEEGFNEVIRLEDEEDVRNYLKLWGCIMVEPPEPAIPETSPGDEDPNEDSGKLWKFPRTQHIFDLGGASRDDLVLSETERRTYMDGKTVVHVTEKVDGAQMGLSMTKDFKIRAQNRSHFVNSKYHSQFKLLDVWIEEHSADLVNILGDSNHVLFGEWLYAQHSVPYDALPSYFIAFDLFNKSERKFYSRQVLEERLGGTSITLVRSLHQGPVQDKQQLLHMLGRISAYSSSRQQIEGIYLKIHEGSWTVSRAKIVRKDFISGNDHWSKNIITKNGLEGAGTK